MIKIKLTREVKFILNTFSLIILMSFTLPLFAEPAPVYDADALEQPYESGGGEQMQDLPPPPNQSNQDSAFIPIQSELQPSSPPPSNRGNSGLERRIQRVEQQINNMQTNDLSAQLESLQNQIVSLRAEIEQVTKAMREAQNQQKTMYADFDNRLTKLSTSTAGNNKTVATNTNANANADVADEATPKATKTKPQTIKQPVKVAAKTSNTSNTSGNQPDVEEEQKIYQNAYNMIKTKKYNDAVNILQSMLQKYPTGQFASNAHYWLGELYGLMGKNDKALNEFDQVVRNFSDSPRVSDAMLKVGLIFAAQSRWADAKTILKQVVNHYPGTASSRLANEQLKQIKQAGH